LLKKTNLTNDQVRNTYMIGEVVFKNQQGEIIKRHRTARKNTKPFTKLCIVVKKKWKVLLNMQN